MTKTYDIEHRLFYFNLGAQHSTTLVENVLTEEGVIILFTQTP